MGRRKDIVPPAYLLGDDDDNEDYSLHKKKHKKHKKHKKKHHWDDGQRDSSETVESDSGMSPQKPPQLKLKIKLGGQTMGTKSVPTFTVVPEAVRSVSPVIVESDDDDDSSSSSSSSDDDNDDDEEDDDEPSEGVPIEQYRAWLDEDSNLEPSPLPDMDTDSFLEGPLDEEEKWLDALEKGELDDNGELKKEIDESLLTARQKALLHKQQSVPLLELPMGYKEKEMTAEMLQKREERARKRRLQAAKKAEENKNQTIERLTKTSKAKIKSTKERKAKQAQVPMVRYKDNAQGAVISYPVGVMVPAPACPSPLPPAPVNCGVTGCFNLKRYSCSKTGTPICSLDCYRKNLQLVHSTA